MLQADAFSLKGMTALVTGAGAGIGRAIAETYAANGAAVWVVDRNGEAAQDVASAIIGRGGWARAQTVDVTVSAQVAALHDAVVAEGSGLDILVNNVGDFLGQVKPFLETRPEDWDALYDVNLRQVMLCTRAFAPLIIEGGRGGSVLAVSSIEAFRAIPTGAAYGAFKTGITGFVRTLAVELAAYGVRVNAIAPETTETEQLKPLQFTKPEHQHRWQDWIPLGRFGRPDDCAGAALYLASPAAQWITGTTLHVDGGALATGAWFRLPGEKQRWTLAPVIQESGLLF
ncbi:MAG TPA: SDR family NAD(P)-dependent oxidoreductase [Spongiibacteraceae bacterium]|jgi:NAD(P)-dependent dehydrogenase (short-subunit alcohol dehydrogenase family)|nr:SDR family NAD(P)-dependent oxidoreductase [Spongiibacteraceae bacterium]HUH37470.1 SDR family NAD(P)-dependent oxidoreductase [Spongiibacteraceae bacterium]